MTVLAFSGSPRLGSAIGHLLRACAGTVPAGVRFMFYERILDLPLFSPDLDGPDATIPATVTALRQQVQAADAILFATPEYAYGIPGSLKNALDWLVSAGSLYGKPTGALSASPTAQGGDKAHASLLLTLTALGAALVPAAAFTVPMVRTRLNASGEVLDAAFADQLHAAVAALTRTIPAA